MKAFPILLGAALSAFPALTCPAQTEPKSDTNGKHTGIAMETVAEFRGPMLTGVTVSHSGRIFVNFPKWGDKVDYTVAELKNGRTIPFPDAVINKTDMGNQAETLVSVQSVVVDPHDRLWILDTGSIEFKPVTYGGPKLVGVDLATNKVVKTILFPPTWPCPPPTSTMYVST